MGAVLAFIATPLGGILARVLLLVVLSVLRRAFEPDRPQRQRSRQTIRAAVTSAKWRIGITRSFGVLSQIAWSGRDLQMTLIIGEAPIAGVTRVWVQGRGVDITVPASGTVDLTADQVFGEGGSAVVMTMHLRLTGAALTTTTRAPFVAAPWDDAEGLRWQADMLMRGLAFAVVECHQDKDNTRYRSIPEVEFRTTGYMWASGSGTPAVITNAAQVRRWWEEEREGEPATRIDATHYTAAVATCTAANYEIHGTVEADDDRDSIRDDFDRAWDGAVVDWGGTLRFLPGVARTKTLDISASDIVELPSVRPAPELHQRVNEVRLRLQQSREADWLEHSMPPVRDTAAQTADGGVLVADWGSVEYMTSPMVATRTAARQMIEARVHRVRVRVPYGTEAAPFQYLGLAPGSIVGLPSEVVGAAKAGARWRVDATGPGPEDTLILSLTEEPSNRYGMAGMMPAADDADVQVLMGLDAPTGLTLRYTASMIEGDFMLESDRIGVVNWDRIADTDKAVGLHVEVFDNQGVGTAPLRTGPQR